MAKGGIETHVSLMYSTEKKDMMVVFDESHKMIGVANPQELLQNASMIDENNNKAIIEQKKLNRILKTWDLINKE